MVVKCFDENHWAWLVDSDYTDEYACKMGIYLGPPDLTEMGLSEITMLMLREKLVDHFFYNAETLVNQRKTLLDVFNELNLTKRQLQALISIYQRDFYGDG